MKNAREKSEIIESKNGTMSNQKILIISFGVLLTHIAVPWPGHHGRALAQPTINSINPNPGIVGDPATIIGQGFDSSSPTNNIINIAGLSFPAETVNASGTELIFTVPEIPAVAPITITGMIPNVPPVEGGQVLITGENFPGAPTPLTVAVGGFTSNAVNFSPAPTRVIVTALTRFDTSFFINLGNSNTIPLTANVTSTSSLTVTTPPLLSLAPPPDANFILSSGIRVGFTKLFIKFSDGSSSNIVRFSQPRITVFDAGLFTPGPPLIRLGPDPIEFGQTISRTLSQSNEFHRFEFVGQEGKVITIHLDGMAGLDPPILFLSPVPLDNISTFLFDDDSGIGLDALLSDVTLPATATYTMEVRSSGDTGFHTTGPYELTLTEAQALEVDIIDPVPDLLDLLVRPIPATDAGPLRRLAQDGRLVNGVGADGVTRVLLRLKTPQSDTVELSLVDEAGIPLTDSEEAGFLTQIGEATGSESILVPTVNVPDHGPMVFAIYHAPSLFFRSASADTNVVERQVTLRARIHQPGGAAQEPTAPIKIVRPPLVLIHGLWSNPSDAWDEFRANIQQALPGIHIVAPTYRKTNASQFSVNKVLLPRAINQAKDQLRSEKIAIVQVDVFGHSMGGLLSRIWAGDSTYRSGENYNEGDINKLVTIDSPHFGAVLADLTIVFLATLRPTNRLALLRTARALGFALDEGAIDDLATFSSEIATLKATSTNVPSHAIVGDFMVEVDLDLTPGPLAKLFSLLKLFGFDTRVDVIPGRTDLVVSATSQAGGLVSPAASTFDHVHTEATSNPNVEDQAVKILDSQLDDPKFSPGFPTN